jgi:hypothetical protein
VNPISFLAGSRSDSSRVDDTKPCRDVGRGCPHRGVLVDEIEASEKFAGVEDVEVAVTRKQR